MTKDPEKQRSTLVWLQWPKKWGYMQVEAGEAGTGQPIESYTRLRSLSCVPWILGAMDGWF